jgi:hypothetical protein
MCPASCKRSRSPSPTSETADSPTKRKRVDEEIEKMLQVPEEPTSASFVEGQPEKLVRDETYYMDDGSCILRVEDTLFNVSLCCLPDPLLTTQTGTQNTAGEGFIHLQQYIRAASRRP